MALKWETCYINSLQGSILIPTNPTYMSLSVQTYIYVHIKRYDDEE